MQHSNKRTQYKRRRQSKTNYKKRLELLKSGKPRLVVRRTNTRLIAQVVKYDDKGDKVLVTVTSSELKDLGWKGSLKSIPAAYLTGRLLAKKANVKEAILDIGLHTPVKGSRIFAVAKGALDGGLRLPVGENIFPSQERIEGQHINMKKEFDKVLAKV
ncbi:50S ribosomal protein L18 [Nanoarchaeota archaeon]